VVVASVEVSAVVGNRLGGWENQRRDGTAAHLAAGRRAAGLPRAARAAELPPPLPARLPSPRPAPALPLADPPPSWTSAPSLRVASKAGREGKGRGGGGEAERRDGAREGRWRRGGRERAASRTRVWVRVG